MGAETRWTRLRLHVRAWLAELLPLLALLGFVALGHALALRALPTPNVWGDEEHYLPFAKLDALEGDTSLVPGRLRFDHRPELASRVFANLVDPRDDGRTIRRVTVMHLGLFLLTLVLVAVQARLLGLSRGAALAATGLLGLFPWFGFHVHSLWPEILHAALLGIALASLLAYLTHWRGVWLVPAGLATGAALLAKGTLMPFVPVLVLVLGLATWHACADLSRGPRRARAGLAAALFAAGVGIVVLPQMWTNAQAGHGWRLSANRWWNLELGLTIDDEPTPAQRRLARQSELPAGLERWLPALQCSLRYFDAADNPVGRERLARERVLAHLRERAPLSVVFAQVGKLVRLVLYGESSFEQSLTYRRRWGDDPPGWLAALRLPGRILWYTLWILGLTGLVLMRWRSAGWLLLSLLTAYFLVALLAVPVKIRFLMPLVPVLCLFSGAALERGAELLRRRRTVRTAPE